MAYYNVEMFNPRRNRWDSPEEDWEPYRFDTPAEAHACMERVRRSAEFTGRAFRVVEKGRYEAIVDLLYEERRIIDYSEAFDTPELGRAGVARLRQRYAAPAYAVWLYDNIADAVLEVP